MTLLKDFRFETFDLLLKAFRKNGYEFMTYEDFAKNQNLQNKVVIIRHDIDRKPDHALKIAKIEKESGVRASYYFGFFGQSFSHSVIKRIIEMGHELGYHYNDLVSCRGNFTKALISFQENLGKLRRYYPVKTMCMHGSPVSRWDNRMLWIKYKYTDYGILSEPYIDLDFNKILYITDASRSWNNTSVTIRDKVATDFNFNFKSTFSIIRLLEKNALPAQILINLHPHNWSGNFISWTQTIIWQGIKNSIKWILNRII
jgi:hypothetical protein